MSFLTTDLARKKKSDAKKGLDVEDDRLSEDEYFREVFVWNPTVANLTLMALGSSAPEILLSIIEVVGNQFHAGELGPGTIVGMLLKDFMAIT